MANNYGVPASAVIFHSPIYIHSHASKLYDVDKAYDTQIFRRVQHDVSKKLINVVNYLKQYSMDPDIQSFYNETHEKNGLRKTRGPEKRILDKMTEYRQKLNNIKKNQNNYYQKEADQLIGFIQDAIKYTGGSETISDFFGDEMAKELVDFLKKEAEDQEYKTKYKKLDPSDTLQKMIKFRKGEVTQVFRQSIEKYYRSHRGQMAENVTEAFNNFQQEIDDYIVRFNDVGKSIMNQSDLESLKSRIQKLNSHKMAKFAITGSGLQLEEIYNFLVFGALLKDAHISLNNINILDGFSQSTFGHELTTDNVIRIINEKTGEVKEIGISLKNNFDSINQKLGTTFTKSSSINLQNILDSLSLKTGQSLLYYLYNRVALSQFAAPKKYSRVIKNIAGEQYVIPKSEPISLMSDGMIELYDSYIALCFIKALVGSLFFDSSFDILIDSIKNRVPPI